MSRTREDKVGLSGRRQPQVGFGLLRQDRDESSKDGPDIARLKSAPAMPQAWHQQDLG